jgi:hypothetical protein
MTQDDFNWTDDERAGLQSYGANAAPSDTLRQRTITALREEHLIGTRPRRTRVVRAAVGIAAAIALFAATASYLVTRSQSNQGVDQTATTTTVERHIIWF